MSEDFYKNLHREGLLSDASFGKVSKSAGAALFSLHWEIKTLLYLGVALLTTGLGLLIYENIDSIGHQFVLLLIGLICSGCFVYCFKYKLPFSTEKVRASNSSFDYILLLANTSFLIFVGYLQFEYKIFGVNYGLATFIPMLVLFFTAYYFDHLGLLSMAIANLAVWMGVSVTPNQLLLHSDFNNRTIIYTYLVLGMLLLAAAYLTARFNFKKHFKFSYQHYGVHVAFIALLAGYFHYYDVWMAVIWMLGIFILSALIYLDAVRNKSFYFLLLVVLYSYIAISSLMIRGMMLIGNGAAIEELVAIYFMATGAGLVFLLINFNEKLKGA